MQKNRLRVGVIIPFKPLAPLILFIKGGKANKRLFEIITPE